jgi:putative transposase
MSDNSAWPHAPPHFTEEFGIYIVTGSTYEKRHYLGSRMRLRYTNEMLLSLASHYGWTLQAWAVLSNHYHFVAISPEVGAGNLSKFISHLHTSTARFLNKSDGVEERRVWHNYWETQITHDTSHYARLKYVNENAVHHGLVDQATDYPWCSARWFERVSSTSFYEMVNSFKIDRLNIRDDF